MNIQKTIYVDMDGVLADFNAEPNAVERFPIEKGFFKNLKPLSLNVKTVKGLLTYWKRDVYILTASPNKQADQDKIEWIKKHMSWFPIEKVIVCRNGDTKADYVKDIKNSILLDDYGKNCREWRSAGGRAIKIVARTQMLNLSIDNKIN